MAIMLILLEWEFPPTFFDTTTHLFIHLVEEFELCGLVHTSCMYLVECYFKTWKGLMRNKQGLKEARHKVMC